MADTIKNTYTLYFYKTSKDSNNKMDFKTNLSMSFGSNSYAVSLIGLKYTKKVYEPCEILVTLSVAASSSQLPTNKEISDTFLNQKVSLEIGSNEVASNYFVYKVKPIFNTTSSASVTVELTIFSADKLMTLDKYSRAYTAKRLYTDILKPELQNFQMIDGTTLDTLVENHTQMLKYKVNESVSGSSDNSSEVTYNDELRIPYIVQYNESFYQFLVRAANRYGEFLYFENGKLNFGMQPSEKNYCDSNDVVIDWSSSSSGVQSRYYESVLSENIAVEDHAYNYKEHEKSDFEDLFASSSGKRHNFDAVPADEWTKQHLKKSFYRTQKDLWQEEIQTAIVELVFKALGTSTLGEFLTSLALETLKKGYDILMYGINCNYTMRKANYAPIKDNADQISGSNYSQFATYDGSSNLGLNLQKLGTTDSITNFTEDFYPLIRNKEKEVGEQAVWLEFGSNFKPIN